METQVLQVQLRPLLRFLNFLRGMETAVLLSREDEGFLLPKLP